EARGNFRTHHGIKHSLTRAYRLEKQEQIAYSDKAWHHRVNAMYTRCSTPSALRTTLQGLATSHILGKGTANLFNAQKAGKERALSFTTCFEPCYAPRRNHHLSQLSRADDSTM